MIKKIIKKHVQPRHYWRSVKFDEISEMYASMTIRSFGLNVIGVFVPIYLYKTGISLSGVFLFLSMFFVFRVLVAPVAGYFVGQVGPKHAIAVSNILFIFFFATLFTYESIGWPLAVLALINTLGNTLFFVAYHTDFSKIKDSQHGGKEIGWLYIFEKLGATIGPLVGGLLAGFFSPQVSIIFATMVIFASLVPLFLTNEPVKTHQKVTYKNFKWKEVIKEDAIPLMSFNVVNMIQLAFWPLYLGIFIFPDNTYESLGLLIGISAFISIVSVRLFGKTVDNNKGSSLLKYGAWTGFMLDIMRIIAGNPMAATVVSVFSEPMMMAKKIPIYKAYYDQADTHRGHRIAYIVFTEQLVAIAKGFTALIGLILVTVIGFNQVVFQSMFGLTALIGLFVLKQRFIALKEK